MSEKDRLLLLYMKNYNWMVPTAAIKAVDSPRILLMLMWAIKRMLLGVRNDCLCVRVKNKVLQIIPYNNG